MNEVEQETYPRIRLAGDSALSIEFGATLDLQINNAAQAFDRQLQALGLVGVTESVPNLRSVLIRYDPLSIAPMQLQEAVDELLKSRNWLQSERPIGCRAWNIPVAYGGQFGADLADVAKLLQMEQTEVIQAHSEQSLRVLTLGFAPGFTYLGFLPSNWNLPRLDYIKPYVPAGSLSVAVCQTVMTSTGIPTGWRTIGRTPFSNFNLQRDPPFVIGAGDEIRYFPIEHDQFQDIAEQVAKGCSVVEPEQVT